MTTKDIIGIVLIAAVIVLAIDKCNHTPVTPPDNTRLTQERNGLLDSAKAKEAVVQTVYTDRVKIKHHYDTIINQVETFDSAKVRIYYDSLVQSQLNAVTNYYKLKSCKAELSKMDSIYSLDSAIKIDLWKAIAISDTIHANDSLALVAAKKDGKRRFWKGFKWGFGSGTGVGTIGTLLLIK